MRRRWMAVIMAAAMLGTMPGFAGAVQAAEEETIVEISAAEELQAPAAEVSQVPAAEEGLLAADDGLLIEEPAGAGQEEPQTDLSVVEDEAPVPSGDMDTSELEADAFPVPDGFLLGIETADDYVPADGGAIPSEDNLEVVETLTETGAVGESGLASTASHPQGLFRTMAAGQYSGSFGAQLDGNAKSVYDAMKKAYVTDRGCGEVSVKFAKRILFKLNYYVKNSGKIDSKTEIEYVDATDECAYAVQAAYDALIYDYPQELFWISKPKYNYSISIGTLKNDTSGQLYGAISKITIKKAGSDEEDTGQMYPNATDDIAAFDAAVDSAAAEIQAGLPDSAAKADKVRAIHDYLCGKCTYDEKSVYGHTPAGVFLKGGNVVCEGYAKAFKILCGKLGVESVMIVGKATRTSEEDHMWNYVRMEDGNWYLVDVTWDDPSNPSGAPRDTYLLKGSSSPDSTVGTTIGERRVVYTSFSLPSKTVSSHPLTKLFTVPVLSRDAYEASASEHEHSWVLKEEKEPTCKDEGYWIYRCECGEESTVSAGTVDHKYSYVTVKEATCQERGLKTQICEYCGAENRSIETIGDHRFETYTPDNNATALRSGTETAFCAYGCGTKDTREIPGTKLPATIQLNYTSLTLQEGQKFTGVQVSGLAKGDSVVSWTSADENVATVKGRGDGLLRATITGGKTTSSGKTQKTKITVKLASGLSKSIVVSVQKKPVVTKSITVPEKKVKLTTGDKYTLEPAVSPVTSMDKVEYTSSAPSIAKVTSKGKVTAVSAGKAKITVQSGSQKVTVTVTVKNPPAERIDGVPATLSIKKGKTKTLKAALYPAKSSGTIKYSSSNKKVVSVTSGGKLTARKKGTADITVKCGKLKVTCTVTVK